MRKPAFPICKNKGADQPRGIRAAVQRLWFCYIDSKIPLYPKFQASVGQPGLCLTWSETLTTGFLMMWLNLLYSLDFSCFKVMSNQSDEKKIEDLT